MSLKGEAMMMGVGNVEALGVLFDLCHITSINTHFIVFVFSVYWTMFDSFESFFVYIKIVFLMN